MAAAFPGELAWDSLLGPGTERLPLHSTPKGGPAPGLWPFLRGTMGGQRAWHS